MHPLIDKYTQESIQPVNIISSVSLFKVELNSITTCAIKAEVQQQSSILFQQLHI